MVETASSAVPGLCRRRWGSRSAWRFRRRCTFWSSATWRRCAASVMQPESPVRVLITGPALADPGGVASYYNALLPALRAMAGLQWNTSRSAALRENWRVGRGAVTMRASLRRWGGPAAGRAPESLARCTLRAARRRAAVDRAPAAHSGRGAVPRLEHGVRCPHRPPVPLAVPPHLRLRLRGAGAGLGIQPATGALGHPQSGDGERAPWWIRSWLPDRTAALDGAARPGRAAARAVPCAAHPAKGARHALGRGAAARSVPCT